MYNVRYCVTPEFPNGTWAYLQSILANGTPFYPYGVGAYYFGTSTAASGVASVTEAVTTVFDRAVNKEAESEAITIPNGALTITWDAIEGGIYRVDTSTTLQTKD